MGESENIIGRLLKETPEDQRKNVVIATKCKPFMRFEQVHRTQMYLRSRCLIVLQGTFRQVSAYFSRTSSSRNDHCNHKASNPEPYELGNLFSWDRLFPQSIFEADGCGQCRALPGQSEVAQSDKIKPVDRNVFPPDFLWTDSQ